jgi:predicted SAM-dependent methyltransferase
MSKLKLDFGCGPKPHEGYVGVDIHPGNNPHVCADIRGPLPCFADNCASEIICFHVLEHIPSDGFYPVMMEMARILEPGGTFEIRVPHPSHDCAMIQGHIHVYTPQWWRDMQEKDWLCGKLVIDKVEEVPEGQAVEDGMFDTRHFPESMRRYLRNLYFETVVNGHKPSIE